MNRLSSTLCLLILTAGASQAQTLSNVVGAGSQESFLTLSFNNGIPNDNFAFGYKYNGTQTGADLLNALIAANIGFNYSVVHYSFGDFITGFSYNGMSEGTPGTSTWSYFTSPNGTNWAYSGVGDTARQLSSGSWDGWSWQTSYNNPSLVTPQTPGLPAAVPEANGAWLALLGVPALLAVCRGRRRSASVGTDCAK